MLEAIGQNKPSLASLITFGTQMEKKHDVFDCRALKMPLCSAILERTSSETQKSFADL